MKTSNIVLKSTKSRKSTKLRETSNLKIYNFWKFQILTILLRINKLKYVKIGAEEQILAGNNKKIVNEDARVRSVYQTRFFCRNAVNVHPHEQTWKPHQVHWWNSLARAFKIKWPFFKLFSIFVFCSLFFMLLCVLSLKFYPCLLYFI